MSPFTLYLVKMLVFSGIFAGYYWLFMRKESFIRWNRWYIMSAMVLSVLLPLVEITVFVETQTAAPVVPAGELPEAGLGQVAYDSSGNLNGSVLLSYLLYTMYALVALLLIGVFTKGLLRINRLKKSNIVKYLEAVKLYSCREKIAPFSFFSNVFIPDTISLGSEDGRQVLQHELEHVRARHSLDKALVQMLCIVFWFNPFFWLFRKELSMVHEFLADRACVKTGGTKELSRLILCSLYPAMHVYFGNQFFQSPIKRRLTMITKNRTKIGSLRKLLVLPVVLACLCVAAINVESKPMPAPEPQPVVADEPTPEPGPAPQPPQNSSADEAIVYDKVQVKPLFQNKDAAGTFTTWAAMQMVYPKEAVDKNIQGKVTLQFTIGSDGKLGNVKVLKGVNPLLDNEAKRVVESSPVWTPGQQDGKNVPVMYTFPIIFTLTNDEPETSQKP